MRRTIWFLGLLCAGDGPVAAEAFPVYTVAVSADLARLAVQACFPGKAPRGLVAADAGAARSLEHAELLTDGARRVLRVEGDRVLVGTETPGDCVAYTVRLDTAESRHRSWRNPVQQVPGAVLVSPNLWLWCPDAGCGDLEVRFHLPAGFQVSAPWQRIAGGDGNPVFRTGTRPADWASRVLLGRFDAARLKVPGATLEVAMSAGDPPIERDRILEWIRLEAQAVTQAYGKFPVERLQVLVVPVGPSDEPVPWGQVMRGGGDAVHLYIDQTQPYQAFLDDWVLVHEMSHLLHPFMHGDGRWLYEGIASYYQNVLRGRAGLLSVQEAWNKLHAGFRRGLKGTRPHQTLAQASETMMQDRGFMRVYWSGAAIALLADLELRRESAGLQSLDTALAALDRCCLPSDRLWSDLEVMQRLDALTGTDVFTGLYHRYRESEQFPELGDAYRQLGLEPISDTEVRLRGDAQATALRDALMGSG